MFGQADDVEVEYATEEVVLEEGAAEEEDAAFFEDVAGEIAVGVEEVAEVEAVEEEVVADAYEEVVYEEEAAAEGEGEVVEAEAEVEVEAEAGAEEAGAEEAVAEEAVAEEAAAVEEEAVAMEEEAAEEEFFMDTAGDLQEAAAEEAVVEGEEAMEVVDDAAVEEVAAEAVAEEGEAVAVEDVELVLDGDAAAVAAVEEEEEDFFTMDTTGEEAAVEAPVEVVADEPMEETPAADDAEAAAAADGQLFGDSVASSFSIDVDVLDDAVGASAAAEEPAAKRQKVAESIPASKDLLFDLSRPISNDLETDGLESPLADGFPDSLEELELTPMAIASPGFTPPSAKWSGVGQRPAAVVVPSHSFPKVLPQGSRGVAPFRPVMPPTSKTGAPPPWQPRGFQPNAAKAVQPQPKQPAFAPRGGPVPTTAPGPGASSSTQLDPNSGYVFICSNGTTREIAQKKLFGSPDRELQNMQKYIKPDTQLFVLNMETLKLLGPFAPASKPEWGIVKGAFGGRFNSQVRALPTAKLMEAQMEKKIPSGYKDAAGMRLIKSLMDQGGPAPDSVVQAWGAAVGGPSVGGAAVVVQPTQLRQMPVASPKLPVRPNMLGKQGGMRPMGMTPGMRPPMQGNAAPGSAARTDKFIAGCDKEGRQYNLATIVVNFCNVGASYASKVLKKDNKQGDRLFDWEGVRKCVRCLTQELGLQVVGCIFENYWGPDNSSPQVPVPADIRAMCTSVQETPCLTGKNHKSADDEMTIKCAYRRNCRFMDNDNYRDWLREMRDQRIRNWLENSQEMLQMRYFFDTDLGSFDTLDGNVPVGLLADQSKAKQMGMLR